MNCVAQTLDTGFCCLLGFKYFLQYIGKNIIINLYDYIVRGEEILARRSKSHDKNKVFLMFCAVLGMLLGWIASDNTGIPFVEGVLDSVGIWIFTASLVAAGSERGPVAVINNLAFYVCAILAFALHGMLAVASLGAGFLVYRTVLAALGSLIGFITWNSSQDQWLGAVSGAVPVSLILAEGFPVIYSRSAVLAFDVVLGVGLFFVLLKGREKKLMAFPFIIIFVFALVYFDAFSKLFGGWI